MKKIFVRKIFGLSLVLLLFIQMVYLMAEPAKITAATAADDIIITLNVTSGVTISNGTDATMSPNMGVTSDRSVGSSSWTVATNSATGYVLAVKSLTSPALKNGTTDQFTDYTEATPGTPVAWGGVPAGGKEFGYSAYGADVLDATWGTADNCGNTGTGVTNVAQKYRGFSTSDVTIASRASVTPNVGVTSSICFAAEQNAVYASSGSYQATITATATAS